MIWVALVVSGIVGLAAWAMYLGVRWPWVSRVAYDDMVSAHAAEREHSRKLTRIIVRLKVSQQAHLPSKAAERKQAEVDEIEQAIRRSKHAGNPAIRTALSNFADAEKAKGTPIKEIIVKLANWDKIQGDDLTLDDEEEDDGILLS